ncbi:MAG: hypothetical protein GX874_06000, partial [Smithella sp.]|nr:hypothetical protein [Smithella sp.]
MNLKKTFATLLAVTMIAVLATACVPTTYVPVSSDTQTQDTPEPTKMPGATDTPKIDPVVTPKPAITKP